MLKRSIRLSVIASLLISNSLVAQDIFIDENEFGDDEVIKVVPNIHNEDNFTVYGLVKVSGAYSYQNKDKVVSSKLASDLKLKYMLDDLYKLKTTIKVYKDYESNTQEHTEFNLNEFSIEGMLNDGIDIKVGRQIVVWGKSDNIRITDILNSIDNTTPGLIDIKDLRLGKTMTKLDYFSQGWSLSSMILHENRFSLMPEVNSDYYLGETPKEPSNSIKNTGLAFSANGNFQGYDISFYLANQYLDNTTYKSNMAGFAYNKADDSFLFKTEVAYFDNYDNNMIDEQIDSLVGLEYNGVEDGSVSVELANKNDDIQYALRFTQSYINQTVDFTLLYSGFGKTLENGGFVRSWLDYAYNDNISMNIGIIDYLGGDVARFENIKDNDRIFTSLTYNF
jgi:hypothetical protein